MKLHILIRKVGALSLGGVLCLLGFVSSTDGSKGRDDPLRYFPALREARQAEDRLSSEARSALESTANRAGVRYRGARLGGRSIAGGWWIVPARRGLCLVHDSGLTASAACVPTRRARSGRLLMFQVEAGETTVWGAVPGSRTKVALVLRGTSRTIEVCSNSFRATTSDPAILRITLPDRQVRFPVPRSADH